MTLLSHLSTSLLCIPEGFKWWRARLLLGNWVAICFAFVCVYACAYIVLSLVYFFAFHSKGFDVAATVAHRSFSRGLSNYIVLVLSFVYKCHCSLTTCLLLCFAFRGFQEARRSFARGTGNYLVLLLLLPVCFLERHLTNSLLFLLQKTVPQWDSTLSRGLVTILCCCCFASFCFDHNCTHLTKPFLSALLWYATSFLAKSHLPSTF